MPNFINIARAREASESIERRALPNMAVARSRIVDLMKVQSYLIYAAILQKLIGTGSMPNLLDDLQPRGTSPGQQDSTPAIEGSFVGIILSSKGLHYPGLDEGIPGFTDVQ
jgi:hypothetical protein